MKNVFNIFELVGSFGFIIINTKAAALTLKKVDPATSPGQHSRADLLGRGLGELARKLSAWEICPHYASVLWYHGQWKEGHES